MNDILNNLITVDINDIFNIIFVFNSPTSPFCSSLFLSSFSSSSSSPSSIIPVTWRVSAAAMKLARAIYPTLAWPE